MDIAAIVDFWKPLNKPDDNGCWVHPADRDLLINTPHSFNLDFPVSPFIGDIINAPVIILGLNAGYDAQLTPNEFPDEDTIARYVKQVVEPGHSDWSLISDYYKTSNSWRFMISRKAAWINASPYRSPNLSKESDNQRLAAKLPSTRFQNEWLKEAILPLARQRKRLIVVKRRSLWPFLSEAGDTGISACKSFVGKHLDARVISDIENFLAE